MMANTPDSRFKGAAWPPTPEAFLDEIREIQTTLEKMESSVPFRSPAVLGSFRDLQRALTKMEAAMERELKVIENLEAVGGLRSASRVARRYLLGNRTANGWIQVRAEDAVQRYQANIQAVRVLIKSIDKLVKLHEREQKSNPRDWGYAGDMYHVKELLTEVQRFLSNYG